MKNQTPKSIEFYFDLMPPEEMLEHSYDLFLSHVEAQHFNADLSKKAQFISYLTDHLKSFLPPKSDNQ